MFHASHDSHAADWRCRAGCCSAGVRARHGLRHQGETFTATASLKTRAGLK